MTGKVASSRRRPSPAMVVAFIALALSIGGTSYAAIKLPANSVGAKQLKKGAVERSKIKSGAIDASKLAPNSTGTASIHENALGKVPSAAQADHAGASAGLDKITYKAVDGTIPAATNTTIGLGTLDVNCDPGQHPLGGGIRLGDIGNEGILDAQLNPTGYEFRVLNFDLTATHTFTGTVTCVPAATVG
jgi:hypothetical protein